MKGDLSGIPVMLVGNKSDEESGKREVGEKTGQALQYTEYRDSATVLISKVEYEINWKYKI